MNQDISTSTSTQSARGRGPMHGRGRGAFGGRGRGRFISSGVPRPPAFRKTDDESGYVLEQNVPGYTKDDLKLRVLNHPRLLELSMVNPPVPSSQADTDTDAVDQTAASTRRPIFRRWRLPVDADVGKIEASIADGVFKARVGLTDPIASDTPLVIH